MLTKTQQYRTLTCLRKLDGRATPAEWGAHAYVTGAYKPRRGHTAHKEQIWGHLVGVSLAKLGLVIKKRSPVPAGRVGRRPDKSRIYYELTPEGRQWMRAYEQHMGVANDSGALHTIGPAQDD